MKSWFHRKINGSEAEKLLLEDGFDGSFLIRPSINNPGNYTLSVRKNNTVLHFPIFNKGEFYYLFENQPNSSLANLVNGLIETKGFENHDEFIKILFPFYSFDPTSERCYHGIISRSEADNCLKDKEIGTFLVRESVSAPGKYVFSVKKSEKEVSHILITYDNELYSIPGSLEVLTEVPKFYDLSQLIEHYKVEPIRETSNEFYTLVKPLNKTKIMINSMTEHIQEMDKNDLTGFFNEFQSLQQLDCNSNSLENCEGRKPLNQKKNRYKNILPYDDTRVRLLQCYSEDEVYVNEGYINANHIKLESLLMSNFIATQGCLKNTVFDFWTMVIQEKIDFIVCLTLVQEQNKIKCYPYWPEEDSTCCFLSNYGDKRIRVTVQSIDSFSHFKIRKMFLMHNLEESKYKNTSSNTADCNDSDVQTFIYMFQFTSWSDKSVPRDCGPLMDFIQKISDLQKSLISTSPILVHCSAGIGRTGVFIILFHIYNYIHKHGIGCEIDIYSLVSECRKQRSGMVQTLEQYKFLFVCIEYILHTLQGRIINSVNDFNTYDNIYLDPNLRK